jgi:signal transduction histidine kinase
MIKRRLAGLKARVISTYLVIFLVSAAIIIGRAGILFAQMAIDTAQHDLELQTYLMASALERPWSVLESQSPFTVPQFQTLTGRFAQTAGGQLTLLDPNGEPLLYSTQVVPTNQKNQPEVSAALIGDMQTSIREDPVSHKQMIYSASAVQRGGHILGVVQMAVPLADVLAKTRDFWFRLGLTALFAAAAAALAGWLLADQLVRPVIRLRAAAARLAGGNLSERVPAESTGGVTELVELGEAFNEMAERIEGMITSQRAFVANASHELRTPLTNVKLRAEALNNGALDDPVMARKFAHEIESEANRLARMANDLLSLTRQDAIASQTREKMNLGHLISEVTGEMSLRASKGGVTLVQEIAPDLPLVNADPAGMQTVLLNLLDNALQYTPPGGTITARACGDEGRKHVIMQVSDTGAGITAEDLPHIFERFYRADKSRSRRIAQQRNGSALAGSGAGLGLAIVHGIVEEHDGAISAESELGHGTTLTVTLPAAE